MSGHHFPSFVQDSSGFVQALTRPLRIASDPTQQEIQIAAPPAREDAMSITGVDAKSANSVRATDPAAAQSAHRPGFAYSSQQYRVVFGAGSAARLNEEVERLGIKRVLVLTTR